MLNIAKTSCIHLAMIEKTLGIDIGSTTLKLCLVAPDGGVEYAILPHEGDIPGTLTRLMELLGAVRPLRGKIGRAHV